MAALTGYYALETGSTKEIQDVLPTIWSPQAFEPEIQSIGEMTTAMKGSAALLVSIPPMSKQAENVKVPMVHRALTGGNRSDGPDGIVPGRYTDDFYHRIHFTPSRLALGNLISTQFRSIEVWNAYFVTQEITDLQSLNAEGLDITSPTSIPYTMLELQSLVYDVSISTDGPPAIDATIRWTIEGVDYDVPVTGNRVISIPIAPDWAKSVKETLEWKTDIIKSYNGEEQRAQIRNKPRRIQSYYYTLKDLQAQQMDNLLWGWVNRLYAIPHWSDTTLNQTDLFVGQTGILTDTDNYAWSVGGLMFLTDGVNYEMQEVLEVNPGQIVLKKGLDNNWQRPSVIGPANLARIDGDMSSKTKRKAANITTATLQFMHEPIATDPFVPDVAATNTYLSDELYTKEPNWVNDLSTDFESDGKVLDFGLSSFALSVRSGFPYIVHDFEWLLKNRTEMTEFREFLGRRAGKFKAVWMPSWRNDFTILEPVTSGSTGFVAKENYYGLLVDGENGRNHVYVQLKNGAEIVAEISAATISNDEVNVVTTTVMGEDFDPSDVRICCILGYYRLMNDRITLEYLDRDVVKVKSTVVNVLP